ncbi:hypothetical protein Vretifemale_9538 [Volvox reticuliferus]|uniref:Uncharacterized protein n=1 Tax=Volvox reticuliferus TaxID=1737510 RepID=A0A8J4CCN2_9CHLO|nr:hypothetical protein Vretifemale_9538 [Volvox reticuliferus]
MPAALLVGVTMVMVPRLLAASPPPPPLQPSPPMLQPPSLPVLLLVMLLYVSLDPTRAPPLLLRLLQTPLLPSPIPSLLSFAMYGILSFACCRTLKSPLAVALTRRRRRLLLTTATAAPPAATTAGDKLAVKATTGGLVHD